VGNAPGLERELQGRAGRQACAPFLFRPRFATGSQDARLIRVNAAFI